MVGLGIQAVVRLICHIIFIMLAFWGIKALRTDSLFKKGHEREIQVFLILLAIAIGYTASSFFLDLMAQSRNLIYFTK